MASWSPALSETFICISEFLLHTSFLSLLLMFPSISRPYCDVLSLCGLKGFVMASAKCSQAQRQKAESRCPQWALFSIKSPWCGARQQYFCICYTSVDQNLVVNIISKQGLQREKRGQVTYRWMLYKVTGNWRKKENVCVCVLTGWETRREGKRKVPAKIFQSIFSTNKQFHC